MLFVFSATDRNDAGNLRLETRSNHLDYLRETGVVKLGGPILDVEGNMVGSMLIFEAADLTAAKAWAADDPYAKAGLFAHSEVRPWKATVNNCGAQL